MLIKLFYSFKHPEGSLQQDSDSRMLLLSLLTNHSATTSGSLKPRKSEYQHSKQWQLRKMPVELLEVVFLIDNGRHHFRRLTAPPASTDYDHH